MKRLTENHMLILCASRDIQNKYPNKRHLGLVEFTDGPFGSILFTGTVGANMESWQMDGLRSTYIIDLLFGKPTFNSQEGHSYGWLRTMWCMQLTLAIFHFKFGVAVDVWCTLSGDGLKRLHPYLVLKKTVAAQLGVVFSRRVFQPESPVGAQYLHHWACNYIDQWSFPWAPCPVEASGVGVTYCPCSLLPALVNQQSTFVALRFPTSRTTGLNFSQPKVAWILDDF